MIGLDTEFVRENTYYPKMGLFQLSTDSACYLIDPLAIDDLTPFAQLLSNPAIVKVLHACSEDLELFDHHLQVVPSPLFDTQIAAAFLGLGMSLGYQKLIEHYFDISLPKDAQRSDWTRRPLSQKQLDYAAQDTRFLPEVYREQYEALRAKDRLSWCEEECQRLLDKQQRVESAESAYRRIKGGGALTGKALNVLQQLAQWRESEAPARDIPKGFIFKDPALVQMAVELPDNLTALAGIETVRSSSVRRYGAKALELITSGQQDQQALKPALPPLTKELRSLLKELQKIVADAAADFAIPAELVCNRRVLTGMINRMVYDDDISLPRDFSGWRQALVGDLLLDRLEQEGAT